VEELASNPYFIVGTGVVTVLSFVMGFFTCKKVSKNKTVIKENKVTGDFAGRDMHK
jgi:hydrogenase-4 membrane subunit HyfE